MKTTLQTYSVREIVDGFIYNELEGKGLFGISGKLTIQKDWFKTINIAGVPLSVDGYMSVHRTDSNITELKTYFNAVIDWVSGVFDDVENEMCGLEWGRLYETYHTKPYNRTEVSAAVQKLYADPYVKNRRGIFEYVLSGETDTKLLEIRIFDEATKQAVFKQQNGLCPLCELDPKSKGKAYKLTDMDADHVTAWSKGGATAIANCQMLCKSHNRAKGNA
jgi:hypothetical protein